MTRLHRRLETRLPLGSTFDFVADFANASHWDPGVVTSERLDAGPPGIGARYRLTVRMGSRVAPMEYRITALEPNRLVVLTGHGSRVSAVDTIAFEPSPDGGTIIDYTATIRLVGWLRFVQPLLGGAFERIASDAAGGMQQALDRRAVGA
jgi:hypothetical protein